MTRLEGPSTLAFVADFIGSTLYRVIWPTNALQKRGYPAYTAPHDHPALEAVIHGQNPTGRVIEALIFPRLYWAPDQLQYVAQERERRARLGVALIGEWDDDLFSPAGQRQGLLMEQAATAASWEEDRQARVHALSYMNGVTVSTPYLAAVLRDAVDMPVLCVPNAVDWQAFRWVYDGTLRTVPGLTIGWAGGKRLGHDIAPMAAAWGRIAQRFPAVTFVVAGFVDEAIRAVVPAERLVVKEWVHIGQFPALYRDVDIGCCPLANAPFNRAKSIVKALEYGAAGAAVVYSPTVYGRVLRHKRDGLEATTADDWEAALAYLIEHPGPRHALARRWQRRVRAYHTTEATCGRWAEAWATIVAHARANRPRLVAV